MSARKKTAAYGGMKSAAAGQQHGRSISVMALAAIISESVVAARRTIMAS